MANQSLQQLLLRWFTRFYRKQAESGFTLIELLVALAIGGIISSALLYGVVELLQTNQRESSRAETQREMQLALDYISADLREAVFVYDGSCLKGTGTITANGCPGIVNHIPGAINGGSKTPILAFWRVDDLPDEVIKKCRSNADKLNSDAADNPIKGIPCLSGRTYSLVVYYLDKTPSSAWKGKTRINRYALTQFNSAGNFNKGWVDPTITINNFLGWPYDSKGSDIQSTGTLPDGSTNLNLPGKPDDNSAALVDFVDDPAGATAACPVSPSTNLPPFNRSPEATVDSSSFYACVRGGGTDANKNNDGRNQEVAIFLRGNAAGRSGIPSDAKIVFNMETRTFTRGSYNKAPAAP